MVRFAFGVVGRGGGPFIDELSCSNAILQKSFTSSHIVFALVLARTPGRSRPALSLGLGEMKQPSEMPRPQTKFTQYQRGKNELG